MLKNIIKITDKNRWIFVFLLCIPFFNEVYPPLTFLGDYIVDLLKLISFLIMIFIMYKKKRKPSILFYCLLAIEIWWIISTFLNYPYNQDTSYYVFHKMFMDNINALSMGLIVECFKDDGRSLIDGLMLNFELALYPNLITVFTNLSERGYYLLGYYAVLILWILPAICVAGLYMLFHKKYVRGSLLIAVCLLTVIMTWCATVIVSIAGMFALFVLGYCLYVNSKTKEYKLPLSLFVILAIAMNVFILFVYSGNGNVVLDFVFEKILGRSTHFSGRTLIWKEAINLIQTSPIIGHGFRPEIPLDTGFVAGHAHNQLLQRLTATGIIGLVLFVLFHIELIRKVDNSSNTLERLVMVSGVFGVTITYMMEAYKKFFRFYLVFFLAYHIDELIKNKLTNTDYLLK